VSDETSVERLSIMEAAEVLGVTRDAIHKRIKRGSLEYEKGGDGRLYVYVDTSTSGLDKSVDESKDVSKAEVLERLIESHQDRIAFLEQELERRGDETTRLHQIVAGLTQANTQLASRVSELDTPRGPRESPKDEAGSGSTEAAPPDVPVNANASKERPQEDESGGTAEAEEDPERPPVSREDEGWLVRRARRILPVLVDLVVIMLVLIMVGLVILRLAVAGSP
jgi:excisionase family DNA binding protein